MKALSVQQPWAWAIIYAGKDIENRTWYTSKRETIAIHASMKPHLSFEFPRGSKKPKDEELSYGAIIGIVDIIDCVDNHRSKWFGGPYGLVLANPRPLPKPIPCKGKLNFWEVPSSALRSLKLQLVK